MEAIPYYHVDVFSPEPFAGNGLIVFTEAGSFNEATMQILTQEMRQYESIFLQRMDDRVVRARIFTRSEELGFAGHPILGAAATLHDLLETDELVTEWSFIMAEKTVHVSTEKRGSRYEALMNQGKAVFGKVLDAIETASVLHFLGATPEELYPGLYPMVVSTGLPYLIIPFRNNGYRARIGAPGLEAVLHSFGAKFIGLLDIETRSIRTGDNDGSVEDIATGSLAGPAGAFLVHHGLEQADRVISFTQGRNLSRNSRLFVESRSCQDRTTDVFVGGTVCRVASGFLAPELTAEIIGLR